MTCIAAMDLGEELLCGDPGRSSTINERRDWGHGARSDRGCARGAVVVAKANLDHFATGLVGTRSPHGTPRNPYDPLVIPGGSSSGSAVAVARGT